MNIYVQFVFFRQNPCSSDIIRKWLMSLDTVLFFGGVFRGSLAHIPTLECFQLIKNILDPSSLDCHFGQEQFS
jgi:hypothetical protein